MKSKSQFQLSARFFSLLLAVSILSFCNLDTPKISEEKVLFKKNIPIALSFMDTEFSLEQTNPKDKDGNSIVRTAIPNVKVSAIDPLKKVLTPNGALFKSMNVSGGVMALYLSDKATLPYMFVVKVEAPGYVTTYKQIKIGTFKPCYFPVYMVNFKSSAWSILNQENTVTIKDGKTEKDEYIGKFGRAEVLIPGENTLLFTRGRKVQSESATIKLSYCIPDSINSIAFPSGYKVASSPSMPPITRPPTTKPPTTNPTITHDKQRGKFVSQPLQSFQLLPYCWLTLEMQANKQNVTLFEKPIKIKLTFPNDEWKGQKSLKNGDLVGLWSLSNDGIWKNEGKVKVQKIGDRSFSTSFEIDHLTTLTIADAEIPCTSEVLTINYKSAQTQTLFSKLIHYPSGIDYGFTSDNNISYNEGNHSISITNVPTNRQLRFVAYDDQNGVGLIRDQVDATTFDCVVESNDLLKLSTKNVFSQTMEFVKEKSPDNDLVLCNMPIWFKSCNSCTTTSLVNGCVNDSRSYEFGGYLDSDGRITLVRNTPLNRFFCIRLCYSSQVGQTINAEYLDFLIDLGSQPTAASPLTGMINNANINLQHSFQNSAHKLKILSVQTVPIPINACEE